MLDYNSATATYDFETAMMEGSIQTEGAYHGVTRLVDKRTGRQVIDARYSALNLFRLFSVNQGMGQPRFMERTTEIMDRAIQIYWPPAAAHQGELIARYEVREPNAIDLTVTLRCQGAYPGYELFLSNYFDQVLRPHVYLQASPHTPNVPELTVPMVNDVFLGTLLVFPRDAHAARRCVDGRWDRSEWDAPVVQQCPVRRYARPLAFLTDPDDGLGIVLMSRPQHCYAISTRYHVDNEADRLAPYSAFDFSLFGDDLLPGDERTVKVRLALTPLDDNLSQPLALYEEFVAEKV